MVMSKVLAITAFLGPVLFCIGPELFVLSYSYWQPSSAKVIYKGSILLLIFPPVSPIFSGIVPASFASIFPPI